MNYVEPCVLGCYDTPWDDCNTQVVAKYELVKEMYHIGDGDM